MVRRICTACREPWQPTRRFNTLGYGLLAAWLAADIGLFGVHASIGIAGIFLGALVVYTAGQSTVCEKCGAQSTPLTLQEISSREEMFRKADADIAAEDTRSGWLARVQRAETSRLLDIDQENDRVRLIARGPAAKEQMHWISMGYVAEARKLGFVAVTFCGSIDETPWRDLQERAAAAPSTDAFHQAVAERKLMEDRDISAIDLQAK